MTTTTRGPVARLLEKIQDARPSGKGWSARCPAHEDGHASLSISEGDDGRALVRCHAGCPAEAIVGALGLRMADLMPDNDQPRGGPSSQANHKPTFPTPEAAIASLESVHGKVSAKWEYHDATGNLVGIILRWNLPNGDKSIKPVSRVGDAWACAGMPTPRPLYRLPELADAPRVVVCEGEKAADAARAIGLTATTSAHGSQSAKGTDWGALAGKSVVILPDNDKAGLDYAAAVAGILRGLKPPAVVKLVNLPGLPDGGDLVEWVETHGDAAEPAELRRQLDALVEQAPRDEPAEKRFEFKALSCADLDGTVYEVEYLVDRCLVRGQPCIIAGGKKTLKTSLIVDMGIALATDGYFLGKLRVSRACNVGIMSGESGFPTLQETARRIASKAGWALGGINRLWWCDQLPRVEDLDQADALERFILDHELEVLFLDPAYLMMSGEGAENLFRQGPKLLHLNRIMAATGCTIVLACHNRKGGKADPFSPPELEDIAWAGFQEWCRQWVLVGRRERYEPGSGLHRLWLNAGGSMGHSALWALDIDEGPYEPGVERRWEVTLSHAEEAREAARDERATRQQAAREETHRATIERDKQVLFRVLAKHPAGMTMRDLRIHGGLRSDRCNQVVGLALQANEIEPCQVAKPNRKTPYDGFRLTEDSDAPQR